ncbi:glycosyltransferase [Citreimonas sp.]|uniref:glycosyltransferase n=1 Tax=Citreimonas sp. TaxID=3036715 RepID=UPI0040593A6E
MIEAYAQAGRSRPDDSLPHLLVAGDGEDRPALESAITRLGLADRIHLPGFFDYDTMPALYGLAHGFVHVPLTEQWGLVVNEAAAAGLPMVLSETCGAATELLEPGRNGWMCAAEDGQVLTSALGAMMSLSTEEAARMGDESRAIVADWGPDRFADELAAAVRIARTGQGGPLSLLDRQIVRYMSRKVIETVA